MIWVLYLKTWWIYLQNLKARIPVLHWHLVLAQPLILWNSLLYYQVLFAWFSDKQSNIQVSVNKINNSKYTHTGKNLSCQTVLHHTFKQGRVVFFYFSFIAKPVFLFLFCNKTAASPMWDKNRNLSPSSEVSLTQQAIRALDNESVWYWCPKNMSWTKTNKDAISYLPKKKTHHIQKDVIIRSCIRKDLKSS